MTKKQIQKIDNLDKIAFYANLIDNLFLPYFWLISIPYSMPITFYWAIKRWGLLRKSKNITIGILLITSILISSAIGSITFTEHSYNIFVYLLSYAYVIINYYIFQQYLKNREFNLLRYLNILLLFISSLAILFYYDKSLYSYLISIWNLRSGGYISSLYFNNEGYRYSFIWSDANNIGYMITALIIFSWIKFNVSLLRKILMVILSIIILTATMSSGARLTFAVTLSAYIFIKTMYTIRENLNGPILISKNSVYNFLMLITILMVSIYYINSYASFFTENSIYQESMQRLEENSSESRTEIWKKIINKISGYEALLHFFVGFGGLTLIEGIPTAPHNGHLYWIISFGIPSYLLLMRFIFKLNKNSRILENLWILPIFLGFSVNVMLGELKLFSLIMLLVAYSRYGKNNLMTNQIDVYKAPLMSNKSGNFLS